MRISDVLRVKGTQVVTVTPDTTVRQLLAVLAEHGVGAVVVSHDGTAVDGIASERDIVRALAQRGAAVMSDPVTAIYTAEVHTVTPQTPIEEVMRMMTERRVRHAPVVADGSLHGIVSIGDVVKIRITVRGVVFSPSRNVVGAAYQCIWPKDSAVAGQQRLPESHD